MSKKDNWLLSGVGELTVNLFIAVIGLIAMVIGILLVNDLAKTILISVGASLLASAIVGYLSSIYIFKRRKEKELTETWGLRAIYKTRQYMNTSCDKKLSDMKERLDISAFGLRSFRHSQDDLIRKKVRQGVNIRILTLMPNSSYLAERERVEKTSLGSMKEDILQLQNWVAELNQIREGCATLKYYDTMPLDFYFRVDDTVFIGPYLFGKDSQQTISWEYGPGEGLSYYASYFDFLWNDKTFCNEPI